MIVILGDHEGLGQTREELLKSSDLARNYLGKGRFTPFIVANSPVAGRYDEVMGQVDVFPTILDFLGVKHDEWRGLGISALDTTRPGVAFSAIRKAQSMSELIIVHDMYGKDIQ